MRPRHLLLALAIALLVPVLTGLLLWRTDANDEAGSTNNRQAAGLACPSPEPVPDSVMPAISREEAIVLASGEGEGFPVKEAFLRYSSRIFSRNGTTVRCPLAWAVAFDVEGLVSHLEVVVDAMTGELLSKSKGTDSREAATEAPD